MVSDVAPRVAAERPGSCAAKMRAAWWMRQTRLIISNKASDARQRGLLKTAGAVCSSTQPPGARSRRDDENAPRAAAGGKAAGSRPRGLLEHARGSLREFPAVRYALLNSKRRGDAGAHCARIGTVGLRRRTPVIPLTRREVTASSSRDAAGQQLRNHSRRHSSQSAARTYTGARAARNEDQRQRSHV